MTSEYTAPPLVNPTNHFSPAILTALGDDAADPATPLGASLSGTFGRYEMPEAYGAAAAYAVGVDDTTFVQAALTAAAGNGRELRLNRIYNTPTGGLASTGTVTIRGIGGMLTGDPVDTLSPTAKSGLRCASGTATALALTNAPGSVLADFAVINDVATAPTSGTGIKFVGDGSTSQSSINRVAIVAFYDLMETSGVFWTLDQCHFYDAVRYGLYLNNTGTNYYDHGDLGVFNSVFAQNYKTWQCGSALRWRAGGGLRIMGNKFLGGATVGNGSLYHFDYCVDVMAANGVATGDITCTGNSISNFSVAGIRLGIEGTTGSFINTAIVGNLINVGYASAKAGIIGSATPALRNQMRCVHIADNVVDNMPGGGFYIFNTKGATVGVNTWQNMPSTTPLISVAESPDDGTGVESIEIVRQNRRESAGDLIVDKRRLGNNQSMSGVIDGHEWTQNLYANVVDTWVTLGYLDLPAVNGGTAEMEVTLTGYDYGVGPMFARYRRILTKVAGNATVGVVTDGTDTTAGTGSHYAVQFVTTTQNRVEVQVKLTTGSATIWGKARLRARGDIEKSHRGA